MAREGAYTQLHTHSQTKGNNPYTIFLRAILRAFGTASIGTLTPPPPPPPLRPSFYRTRSVRRSHAQRARTETSQVKALAGQAALHVKHAQYTVYMQRSCIINTLHE